MDFVIGFHLRELIQERKEDLLDVGMLQVFELIDGDGLKVVGLEFYHLNFITLLDAGERSSFVGLGVETVHFLFCYIQFLLYHTVHVLEVFLLVFSWIWSRIELLNAFAQSCLLPHVFQLLQLALQLWLFSIQTFNYR